MADIDKIRSGSSPSDSPKGSGKKDKVKGDEFKEFMKVDEVGETDADQRRKRKERAEDVEEGEEIEETATPREQVAPFTLESPEKKQAGPAEIQSPSKPSPMELAGAPITSHTDIPIPENIPLETSSLDARELGVKEVPPSTSSPVKPSAAAPSQPDKDLIEKKREAEKKGTVVPEPPPQLEEKESYFQQKAPLSPGLGSIETPEESTEIEEAIPQTLPSPTAPVTSETEAPKLEETEVAAPSIPGAPTETPSLVPLTPTNALPTYTQLTPQVLDLYERMVGVITVMRVISGITETTIHLNSEQFASSIFYGTQIIISEDKNAQNQFNIEINTPSHTAPLLQENLKSLLTSFERGGYQFQVKQIRINIIDDSEELFKRKAKAGEEEDNDTDQ